MTNKWPDSHSATIDLEHWEKLMKDLDDPNTGYQPGSGSKGLTLKEAKEFVAPALRNSKK